MSTKIDPPSAVPKRKVHKPPAMITHRWLDRIGACPAGLAVFDALYPCGTFATVEAFEAALDHGFEYELNWLCGVLGITDQDEFEWAAYEVRMDVARITAANERAAAVAAGQLVLL